MFTQDQLNQAFATAIYAIKNGISTPAEIEKYKKHQENYQMAHEKIPHTLVPVTMLYIPIIINDTYITAFVDTGARISIMNYKTAILCGLENIIYEKEQFDIIAAGDMRVKTRGKIYYVDVQVGEAEFGCGFTVIDGGNNVIIGLDILKQHQCKIDLDKGVLQFGNSGSVIIPFLGEKDICDE
jgi:DNA damage-inducible protein 1